MEQEPIRVLFVCLANICRSPMAEALMRSKVEQAGLQDRITISSAGVNLWQEGAGPHEGTIAVLKAHGIKVDHKAQFVRGDDLRNFDYVLAMDNEILRSIWAMGKSKAKAYPLVKFAPGSGCDRVADPIGTTDFDACFDLIDRACDGFLAYLRKTHKI